MTDTTTQTLADALIAQATAIADVTLMLRHVVSTTDDVRACVLRLEERIQTIEFRLLRLEKITNIHERPTQPELNFLHVEPEATEDE